MKRQRFEWLERLNNDSFEWETKFFNFFFKKSKKSIQNILALQREKRDVVVVLVITWSLYSSLSRFCDVVVVVFVEVVQNNCKESFTQRQQQKLTSVFWANWRGVCANECIYFFAANIYILLTQSPIKI